MYYFFFNDTATTEIYTLSLHDALPISPRLPAQLRRVQGHGDGLLRQAAVRRRAVGAHPGHRRRRLRHREDRLHRSEEHTSELQSRQYLVCRLLLEKKI